jgi:eukaryotic-like serine/threonine-protein kinase
MISQEATRRVSHYRLLRQLGSGGMGDVYAADDERLRRTVALKILTPEMSSDPARIQRFECEARAAGTLVHPNIAQVYEAGTCDGTRYIAMELVEGETLEQRIARAEIPIPEIVRIGVELTEAVAEAHRHRIIHRDIKSSNLMLSRSGHLKVLDFGLARIDLPSEENETTQRLTLAGVVMGTPHSMSPEQALGQRGDARSDIFSIGVVLYQMVTRRIPFRGANATETIQKVINAEPEPMARFNYGLPVELEQIIRKCLEKEPKRRYQSVQEIFIDLRNLNRDLTSGRRPAPGSVLRSALRPRSRLFMIVILPLLLVASILTWQRQQRQREPVPPIRSVVVFPFMMDGAAEGDAYFADGMTENVISSLSQIAKLRVMNRSTSFSLKEGLESARRLKVDAYLTGRLRYDGDVLVATVELVRTRDGSIAVMNTFSRPRAERGFIHRDVARMVASGLGEPGVEQKFTGYGSMNPEAYGLYLQGRHYWQLRTEAGMRQGIELFERAVELDPDYASAYAGLADSYSLLERYAGIPAAAVKLRARNAARRALRLDPSLPDAHVAYASYLETFDWDWVGAEDAYRQAIELAPSHATAYHWNAMLLTRLGRHPEAIENIEAASRLDPKNPLLRVAAANVHYYAGNYPQAAEGAREALTIDPSSVLARIQLGLALSFGGEHALAIHELQRAWNEADGTPAVRIQALAALGFCHAAAGDPDKARRIAEQLQHSPRPTLFSYALAAIYATLGENDAAFEWLERALESQSFWLSLSGVEPAFGPLRADRRYDELLERVGLPSREEFGRRRTRG